MGFNEYISDVLSGKIITCKYIKLACERHLKDLERQNTESFPYYFDELEAAKVINTVQVFRHWKGAKAGERIVLENHQQFYFGSLFGWKNLNDDSRRFRTSYKEVARKNAKTTECAMKTIYHIIADMEHGAQVYFAATKEEQARIGFNDTKKIIEKTPELRNKFKIFVKSITYGDSFMKPLGSDSDTQDGFDPSWGVIDEYHAHPTDSMLNVLESGMGARSQPVIDVITTAGFNRELPCYALLRRTAIQVLEGSMIDDALFAMIFTLDEDDSWEDEKNWIKANPNLGISVNLDFLRVRYVKAKNEGGSKEVDFKTKNLNVWTDSAVTWIPDDKWMECVGDPYKFTRADETHVGLDLATTRDFCSMCRVTEKDGIYHSEWKFYIPEDSISERYKDNPNIPRWISDGFITVTPGNVVDYDFITNDLIKWRDESEIVSIGYDPYNATQTAINLQGLGFNMNPFRQGWVSMNEPTKIVEKLIFSAKLNHGGNPVARWQMANVILKIKDAENYMPDKGKSSQKIDGIVALIMAVGETNTPSVKSIYERKEMIVL